MAMRLPATLRWAMAEVGDEASAMAPPLAGDGTFTVNGGSARLSILPKLSPKFPLSRFPLLPRGQCGEGAGVQNTKRGSEHAPASRKATGWGG